MFYLELFRQLQADHVRYMIVGGLAMNLLGVPRSTMDVDLVLALDQANLRNFLQAAKHLGLQPVAPLKLEELLDPARRRAWQQDKGLIAFALRPPPVDAPTIDILIDPPIDIDAALARVVTRSLENIRLPVISVPDLIALKEHAGREQDLADIEHLRRLENNR